MWKGTAALQTIDQSLQSIRNDVVRLDSQLNQLTSEVAQNQRHRAKLFNEIAKVRLNELDVGELHSSMTAADQSAVETLAQRDEAIAKLAIEIESSNEAISSAEQARERLLAVLNEKAESLIALEAAVQQQLKSDDEYMQQFDVAKKAESIAEEALKKVQKAQTNMAKKAEPYQADKLFMYLWNRGFGTTEYSAGLFARFADSWVAKLIDYEPARVNYWNLEEIPKRLNDHAEYVGDQADTQHMLLQQFELDALESMGVKALEADIDQRRDEIDKHDDSIEALELSLNEQLDRRAKFVAGEDQYIRQCLQRLSSALEHKSLAAIHRYVGETVSPTDDRLVIELQTLDDTLQDVEQNIIDVRNLHDKRFARLRELEKVRRDFKNSRFDDARSGFGNQSLISGVISQFMQGLVSGADVWQVIKRNQRYRNVAASPDFGSGGLGEIADMIGGEIMRQGRRRRSNRGSTWNMPKPRRGGGVFRAPRGGGSGGGGFKTGGGF